MTRPFGLTRGDVMIARGPGHYTVAGDPATPPAAVILPGQRCVTLEGEDLQERWRLGVRTWGNAEDGQTLLITGAYHLDGEVSDRLLRVLPDLLVLRDDEWDSPVIPLLTQELVKDEPGQEAVLDRLLDLLLIAVLRAWFARPEAQSPAWYRAARSGDRARPAPAPPQPRPPLDGGRTGPGDRPLPSGARTSLQRPGGRAPMSFLTSWRIALAADLLLEPGATVGSVAPKVGYSSPFALSTAFKRVRGMSPQQYRTYARGRGREDALSASG